jgi:hypothetical protein
MIASHQSGEKSEASRQREGKPEESSPDRAAKIERRCGISGDHFDADRHLSECLSANGKSDEIPHVLNKQVSEKRALGKHAHVLEHQATELQGEIDDNRVNQPEDDDVHGHRDEARHQARVLIAGRIGLAWVRVQRASAEAKLRGRSRGPSFRFGDRIRG